MRIHSIVNVATFAFVFASATSFATDRRADSEVRALAARVEALEQKVAEQAKQIERQALAFRDAQWRDAESGDTAMSQRIERIEHLVKQEQVAMNDRPREQMSNGRPTIESADGRFTFSPRAVAQLDSAWYDQRGAPLAVDFRRGSVGTPRENNSARDLSDGAYFRRARFGFEGTFEQDFSYRLMLELGGAGTEGPTRINDAWISYAGFAPFSVQIGAFSPAANMADGTSVDDLLFPERPTAAELGRTLGGADGRIGVGLRYENPRMMAALTATTRTVNDAETLDSQFALVGRVGWLVFTDDAYNVHIGASSTYVLEPADNGAVSGQARYSIRFRDRPELRVDSTRLIDTGALDADSATAYGVEFGANYRNFILQGEHFWFAANGREPVTPSEPSFRGWYLEGSWVLTGEAHRYNARNGAFQSPRPNRVFAPSDGGWGAWELAVRHSTMNLNDHAGAFGEIAPVRGVRGGKQSIWAFGLNGYLSANTRVLFDYFDISVDRLNPAGLGPLSTPFGAGAATPPVGVDIGQDLHVFSVRTQYSF